VSINILNKGQLTSQILAFKSYVPNRVSTCSAYSGISRFLAFLSGICRQKLTENFWEGGYIPIGEETCLHTQSHVASILQHSGCPAFRVLKLATLVPLLIVYSAFRCIGNWNFITGMYCSLGEMVVAYSTSKFSVEAL